jgi:DNA-binding NtrC family response regulator
MALQSGNRATVLVVDDEEQDRAILSSILRGLDYAVETATNGREALARLDATPVAAIITDLRMPVMDGFELLRTLSGRAHFVPAIVLTSFGDISHAVTIVHDLQAFWFLEKPAQPAVLATLVSRAIKYGELHRGTKLLERQLSQQGVLGEMIGNSRAMRQAFALIERAASAQAPVLITGESGTGKEMAARAIHRLSARSGGPFVGINCAALPGELIESELFGHERGAFTGAAGRHEGCFEQANHGTLLLDEIGEMPLGMQARLLRVLEESTVRRIGGSTENRIDVRVVAATNRPISGPETEKVLRKDLLYRLNVFHVHLPPLRERTEDIPDISKAIIGTLNEKHDCAVEGLHRDVLKRFASHSWPGNVRELRNVLEWAVITARTGLIQTWQLPKNFSIPSKPAASASAHVSDGATRFALGRSLEEVKMEYVEETLKSVNNDRRRAAQMLGVSLRTLYNWLPEARKSAKAGS